MRKGLLLPFFLICILSFPAAADANIIKNNRQASNLIALTFDDGPHIEYTDEILDILRQYNIKATFFVVGLNVKYFPDQLKRIVSEGHEVGNHTYHHKFLTRCDDRTAIEEIKKTEEQILQLTGVRPKVFRPPGGMFNERIGRIVRDLGYVSVLWSRDPRDWSKTCVDRIEELIVSNTTGGDIILLHDFNHKNSPTPEALRRIIPQLLKKGYRFVTVSDIIAVTIEDRHE